MSDLACLAHARRAAGAHAWLFRTIAGSISSQSVTLDPEVPSDSTGSQRRPIPISGSIHAFSFVKCCNPPRMMERKAICSIEGSVRQQSAFVSRRFSWWLCFAKGMRLCQEYGRLVCEAFKAPEKEHSPVRKSPLSGRVLHLHALRRQWHADWPVVNQQYDPNRNSPTFGTS